MYCDGSSFRPDINKDFSLDRRRHNVPLILKNGTKSKVVAQRVIAMEAYERLKGAQVLNALSVAKTGWTQLGLACPALRKHDVARRD